MTAKLPRLTFQTKNKMWTGGDTVVTYIDNNSIKRVFQSLLEKNIDINYGKYSHQKKNCKYLR